MFRPSTPPASLIILAAMSWPSRTCAPWLTEPGGDMAMVTPILIGSAASAAPENAIPAASARPKPRKILVMQRTDSSLVGRLARLAWSSRAARYRSEPAGARYPGYSARAFYLPGGQVDEHRRREAGRATPPGSSLREEPPSPDGEGSARVPLRQRAVVVEHGLQQTLGAGRALLLRGELGLVVAHPVMTRHENHGGRRHPGNVSGVVPGARHDLARRKPRLRRGLAHRGDALRIEGDRRLVPDLCRRPLEPQRLADLRDRGEQHPLHGIEHGGLRMPEVHGEMHLARHDIGRVRLDFERAHRADRERGMRARDRIDLLDQAGGGGGGGFC